MKKLFLMLTVMMASTVMMAQWVKPTIPAPEFTKLVINEADAEETVVQYLYNVEAGGFLLGANDWNTRASISPKKGYKFKVTANGDGTVTLNDSVDTQKAWKAVFADNAQSIWVDNLGGANVNSWVIESAESNIFYITNQGVPAEQGHGHLGMATWYNGDDSNTRLWLYDAAILNSDEKCIFGTEESFCDDWAAVSQEAYNKFLEDNAEIIAAYDSLMTQYKAALALKATLDKVLAEKSDLDLAAEQAVYNNPNSTAAEMNAAATSATTKLAEWKSSLATVDNPADATDRIVNPNFDGIKFDGWKGSSFGAGGATDECGERYNMTYDTYQIIENVPNGVYRVNVNAFYRAGSIDNDWATQNDPTQRLAKLYAVSGEDSLTVGIRSLASVAHEGSELGGAAVGTTGYYVPNSMQDFVRFENGGVDMDNTIMIPVLNNTLKIGVVKKTKIGDTDWTITDTWRLTYYGNELEAYKMWSEDVIKTIAGDLQDYITEDTYYCRAEIANFQDALAAARAATTAEDIRINTLAMTAATERALASIKAYEDYYKQVQSYLEGINSGEYDFNGELWEKFVDMIQAEIENTLAPGELSTEEINAKAQEVAKQFDAAVKASISEGDDVTRLIANASFADGFNGWTKPGAGGVGNFSTLEPKVPNNVEVYENTVEIYQEIEGVPDGVYSLSVNAFERPAGNGNYTGEEDAKVFLYMNEFQTPVQNIVKDAIPVEEAEHLVNSYFNAENRYPNSAAGWDLMDYNFNGAYVPNGMVGAAVAFNADRYKQTVYGYVKGGKMKIGLTSNGVKAHWVLWSNFKLTYEGSQFGLILTPYIAEAESYLEKNEFNITNDAAEALREAISDAEAASSNEEAEAALESLNAALIAARENANVVAKISGVVTKLEELGEKTDDMKSDELTGKVDDLLKYFNDADTYLFDTAEGIQAKITEADALEKEVNEAYTAWQLEEAYKNLAEEVEGASDDDPINVTEYALVNPDLSTGNIDGWTLDITTCTNKGYQANTIYSADTVCVLMDGVEYTAQCNQFIEVWRSGNAPILGDIYQSIMLPAGTYVLGADIIAVNQGDPETPVEGCFLYAGETHMPVASGNGKPAHFDLIFKVAEDKTVLNIGINCSETTLANWLAADNFTLTAYGKDSKLDENGEENAIESIAAQTQKAIYTITGVRMNKALKPGLYIINGKKMLVK